MTILTAPSDAAKKIGDALGLPKNTVAFTLRVRAGEAAMLEVECYAEDSGAEELATVLKRYRLVELEAPDGGDLLQLGVEPNDDICGFCGLPGANKEPHPIRWPGEAIAGTKYVHADCEDAECRRAHSLLSDKERERFLLTI